MRETAVTLGAIRSAKLVAPGSAQRKRIVVTERKVRGALFSVPGVPVVESGTHVEGHVVPVDGQQGGPLPGLVAGQILTGHEWHSLGWCSVCGQR